MAVRLGRNFKEITSVYPQFSQPLNKEIKTKAIENEDTKLTALRNLHYVLTEMSITARLEGASF